MKTKMMKILRLILKIKDWLMPGLLFMLKFWKWKVWKKSFWSGKTEYWIGFIALVGWLLFAIAGKWFGWATYPAGYFQKICFGIVAMSIIAGVAWIWLGATFPNFKKLIDPDTFDSTKITQWERIKISFSFYALYAAGAVLLASLY
jgi:hypothetical protein